MEKECLVCKVSSTMLSPLISWILPSSSSSSSSYDDDDEEEESLDVNTGELDHDQNDNVTNEDNHQNDHFLTSCDVDDDDNEEIIPVALVIPEPSPAVTVAFPTADETNTTTATATTIATRPKRQRAERTTKYYVAGRQYQRLWIKKDEIELLKGYLDYMKQHKRETTSSLQNDVALLYDHVKPKLNVDFNKNQLVEKLRRLKRKHKVSMDKVNSSAKEVSFKSPQDKAIFDISHKIWGNDKDQDGNFDGYGSSPITESTHDVGNDNNNCDVEIDNKVGKRLRLNNDQNSGDSAISIQGLVEETMRSCFSPLLKEVLDNKIAEEGSLGGLELKLNPMPLCSGELRKRRILELEVYLNRLELLQTQIKARLEELRSG